MFAFWAVLVVLGAFGAFRGVRYAWINGSTRRGTPVSRILIIFVVAVLVASFTLVAAAQLGFIADHAL